MSGPLYSASWYRVAELRPRLRPHARIHRHRYRDQTWYHLQDLTTQRFHRFTEVGHAIIGWMDGERTVEAIWQLGLERLGDDAPTQDEMIELLGQLHAADVLQAGVSPDAAEVLERAESRSKRERRGRYLNPLAIRIPLLDPDRFLERAMPLVAPFFSRAGLALWCVVLASAAFVAASRWDELTAGVFDHALAAGNLAAIWLTFPVLKALHEFGHGFAARRFGGEVHDMGIMLLVLTPVPYVDATSAYAFADKRHRMLVGAAGMIVEGFVAGVALIVWTLVEPGAVRSVAYNVVLVGGVTTLLFNANPLLRFDGYYILADWLEIPNLRGRSNAFVQYLVERYVFGRDDATTPEDPGRERTWLVGFAVTSFLYRTFVMAAIVLFLLDQSLVVGGLLALVAGGAWLVMPLWKGFRYLTVDPRLGADRARAQRIVALAAVSVVFVLTVLPMPDRTHAEGVVWLPDEATVRVQTSGFVERVVAVQGEDVDVGQVLFELRNPELERDIARANALLRELRARWHAMRLENEARAQLIADELEAAAERVERFEARRAELVIRSRVAGEFVSPRADEWVGRFVRKGDLLGHVLAVDHLTVRTVVSDERFDLVRDDTRSIEVRLADRLDRVMPAEIERIVPAARRTLPAPALGVAGGGEIAIDPRDENGTRTLRNVFQLDLTLPDDLVIASAGGRVYVRFDHAPRSLAGQWARSLRQLFLSRFNV